MKIAFYTLGCKVNQFETQAMEVLCARRGHQVVDFSQAADAYVLNTCTVTAVSDKKSRQALRRARKLHPEALIAVCGCFPQVDPEQAKALHCADVVAGTGEREKFIVLIEEAYRERRSAELLDQALKRKDFEELPAGGLLGHTRAMLKVQDGCSNFCAYCIIPYARGPVRSTLPEQAEEQVRELARKGYREIVVTGIEISSYGRDLTPRLKLVDLLERLLCAAPQVRFRLGSLEPRTVDEEFCQRLSGFSNLCPQFHLSLQSGCDATLERMRRRYNTARYLESVQLLRRAFPGCGVTTDLIVGFPGEDEAEFSQTLAFLRTCGFSGMHIFPYSKRKGTPAAEMTDQKPRAVKEERARRAAQVCQELESAFLTSCVGTIQQVLFEEESGGVWSGHSGNYAQVRVRTDRTLKNRLCNVRILRVEAGGLTGELVPFPEELP